MGVEPLICYFLYSLTLGHLLDGWSGLHDKMTIFETASRSVLSEVYEQDEFKEIRFSKLNLMYRLNFKLVRGDL